MQKLLLFLLIIGTCQPAKTQSLTELLQLAATNNLELKALNESYQAARERGVQVSQRPDPTISVGAFVLPIETRLGVQRVRIGAMQELGNRKARLAKEIVLNTRANAEGQDRAIKQLTINFQIKKAYYELYELDKSQPIIQRNIQLLASMNQLMLSRVESGKGSTVDALKVTLKIQALQQQLVILSQQRQKPLSVINQLLNRPLATSINTVDSLTLAIIPYKMDEIRGAIQQEHPLIQRYSFEKEAVQQNLKLNQLNQRPTFSVGIDYVVLDKIDNFEFARNGRDAIMPKASVKIPLDKTKYRAKQREEEWHLKALETQQKNAQSQFLEAINQAFIEYETIRLRLDLYAAQIETTKSMINVLATQYSAEGKGFEELLQQQISLVNYDLLKLGEIVKSHIVKAKIESYLPFD